MAIRRKDTFRILTLEEYAQLSDYKRRRYDVQIEAFRKRKQIQENFQKYLNESIDHYSL